MTSRTAVNSALAALGGSGADGCAGPLAPAVADGRAAIVDCPGGQRAAAVARVGAEYALLALPRGADGALAARALLDATLLPMADALAVAPRQREHARRAFVSAALALDELARGHAVRVPAVVLEHDPALAARVAALRREGTPVTPDSFGDDYAEDVSVLNSLQARVSTWGSEIERVCAVARTGPGVLLPADEEALFWASVDSALASAETALSDPCTSVTLALLARKRRLAGFLSDSRDALSSGRRRAQGILALVQSLPLGPLRSAEEIPALISAIKALLSHVTSKLRLSSFPLSRALTLVAALGHDVSRSLCRILARNGGLLAVGYKASRDCAEICERLFRTWDEGFDACRLAAVERAEARGEVMEPLPKRVFTPLQTRLRDIAQFRSEHEALLSVVTRLRELSVDDLSVASRTVPLIAFDEESSLSEILAAFEEVSVRTDSSTLLDVSADGDALWHAVVSRYSSAVARTEEALASAFETAVEQCESLDDKAVVGMVFSSVLDRPAFSAAVSGVIGRLAELARFEVSAVRTKVSSLSDSKPEGLILDGNPLPSDEVVSAQVLSHCVTRTLDKVKCIVGEKRMSTDLDLRDLSTECDALCRGLDPLCFLQDWAKLVPGDAKCFETIFSMPESSDLCVSLRYDIRAVADAEFLAQELGVGAMIPEGVTLMSKHIRSIYPAVVRTEESLRAYRQGVSALKYLEDHDRLSFERVIILLKRQQDVVRRVLQEGSQLSWQKTAELETFSLKLHGEACLFCETVSEVVERDTRIGLSLDEIETLNVALSRSGVSDATLATLGRLVKDICAELKELKSCDPISFLFPSYLGRVCLPKLRKAIFELLARTLLEWVRALRAGELDLPRLRVVHNAEKACFEFLPEVSIVREAVYRSLFSTMSAIAKHAVASSSGAGESDLNMCIAKSPKELFTYFLRTNPYSSAFRDTSSFLQNMFRDLEEYLGKWLQYEGLWKIDLGALSPSSSSSNDLSQLTALLSEIRAERSRISTLLQCQEGDSSTAKPFAYLVDAEGAMRGTLTRAKQFETLTASNCLRASVLETSAVYNTASETMVVIRDAGMGDPMDLVLTLKSVEQEILPRCNERLESLRISNVLLRDSPEARKSNSFEDGVDFDSAAAVVASLGSEFSQRKRHLEADRDSLKSRYLKDLESFEDNLAKLFNDSSRLKEEVTGSDDAESMAAELGVTEKRLSALRSQCDRMKSIAVALEVHEPASDLELDTLCLEIRDMKTAMSDVASLQNELRAVKSTRFGDMEPKRLRTKLESLTDRLREFQELRGSFGLACRLEGDVSEFLEVLGLLSALRTARLSSPREREVTEKLLGEASLETGLYNVTLESLLACGIAKHETYLKSLFESAAGESSLAAFLASVAEVWTSRRVSFSPRGPVQLIHGIPELLDDANEHLQALGAMCGSSHARLFESERASWELRLSRFRDECEVWADVQTRWLHLNSLFADGSATALALRQQLSQEYASFKSVQARLSEFSSRASGSTGILEVLEKPSGLERMAIELAAVVRGLSKFLESEREKFPRFFYLSDEDLLSVLSVGIKDFDNVIPHLSKIFPGVSLLTYSKYEETAGECSISICGVISGDGEHVALTDPVVLSGKTRAVAWLHALEKELQKSLQCSLSPSLRAVRDALYIENAAWDSSAASVVIQHFPSQMILLAAKILFTEVTEACMQNADPLRVGSELSRFTQCVERSLRGLTEMNDKELPRTGSGDSDTGNARATLRFQCVREQLIKELVFQRGVLLCLCEGEQDCCSPLDFRWAGQLRFYAHTNASPQDLRVEARMSNSCLSYGWEYLGVGDTLVQTPLTRRCFLTLTQALRRGLGASPFGPAGTGKTESVKALGRLLGRNVSVFNCDESFDAVSVGRILAGVCRTGSWVCFDEFNRLTAGILSSTSNQLARLQTAIQTNSKSIPNFYGGSDVIKISSGVGVFVTMNPSYSGRRELPGNLTSLFRPFAMTKPDSVLIAEVSLLAQGFHTASKLARNLVQCFDDMKQALPRRIYYDFGLRSLKCVVQAGGKLRRSGGDQYQGTIGEEKCAVRALVESVKPKIMSEDLVSFESILAAVFPDTPLSTPPLPDELMTALSIEAHDACVHLTAVILQKIAELHNILEYRPAVIMLGPSGSGKTIAWQLLQRAMVRLVQAPVAGSAVSGPDDELSSKLSVVKVIDPKLVSSGQLYGSLDVTTREWKDGLFAHLLRRFGSSDAIPIRSQANRFRPYHWIVFDGDVDPDWAENLNSVLDDSRVLTLPTGERIPLPENVRIIFETDSLLHANPSTVSRCGMVCFSSADSLEATASYLGDMLAATSVLHARCVEKVRFMLPISAQFAGVQQTQGHSVMPVSACGVLGSIFASFRAALKRLALQFETSSGRIQDGTEASVLSDVVEKNDSLVSRYATRSFLIAIVSGVGGPLFVRDQALLSEKVLTDVAAVEVVNTDLLDLPEGCHLCDVYVDAQTGAFVPFKSVLPTLDVDEVDPLTVGDPDVVVPTVTTQRNSSRLAELILGECKPMVTLVGPPGCGKSMVISDALKTMANVELASMSFSSTTTPEDILSTLRAHASVRKLPNGDLCLSPKTPGSRIVLFCDEVNLGAPDVYGSQKAASFIRQLLEKNGYWSKGSQSWIRVENLQIVAACNPPEVAGRQALPTRLLRHSFIVRVEAPTTEDMHTIFGTLNQSLLRAVDPQVQNQADALTSAMVSVFDGNRMRFSPPESGPLQPHYVYSPRDVSRWLRGMRHILLERDDHSDWTKKSATSSGAASFFASESIEGHFGGRHTGVSRLSWGDVMSALVHEGRRLFCDRLVLESEQEFCESLLHKALTEFLGFDGPKISDQWYSAWPKRHKRSAHSAKVSAPYQPVKDVSSLRKLVYRKLRAFGDQEGLGGSYMSGYGATNSRSSMIDQFAVTDDVLKHLTRIERVLRSPLGHAVLIGAPGSGKKTLARFAAWMGGLAVHQVRSHSEYTSEDFASDLRSVLRTAGVSDVRVMMIFDESNALDGEFLEMMNAILACGDVPGLFEGEERVALLSALRKNHFGLTSSSTDEALYKSFINRVRTNLHIVFTLTCDAKAASVTSEGSVPVGSELLTRSPALYNRCVVDWMGDWDSPTLEAVADLKLEVLGGVEKDAIVNGAVRIHNSASKYLSLCESVARFATPRHYLEFVEQMNRITIEKASAVQSAASRLTTGLERIQLAGNKVDALKGSLSQKAAVLSEKEREANQTLEEMSHEQGLAEKSKVCAEGLAVQAERAAEAASERKSEVAQHLASVEPKIESARRAVGSIRKENLDELRAMPNPPTGVRLALQAVVMMLDAASQRPLAAAKWQALRARLRGSDLIPTVMNFDPDCLTPSTVRRLEKDILSNPDFDVQKISYSSRAAGPLAEWTMALIEYAQVNETVAPLRAEAERLDVEQEDCVRQKLEAEESVQELGERVTQFRREYASIVSEAESVRKEIADAEKKITEAEQTLESLGDEWDRWKEDLAKCNETADFVWGDAVLGAAFVSYAGALDESQRSLAVADWRKILLAVDIPVSENLAIGEYLSSELDRRMWRDAGLSMDASSVESYSILKRSARYPLVVDPSRRMDAAVRAVVMSTRAGLLEDAESQEAGTPKNVESRLDKSVLSKTSFASKGKQSYLRVIESAMRFGTAVFVEDAEQFDLSIAPVLGQEAITGDASEGLSMDSGTTGGSTSLGNSQSHRLVRLGDRDVDQSPLFRMFLSTTDLASTPSAAVSRCCVVSFSFSAANMQSTCLSRILHYMTPTLETKRMELHTSRRLCDQRKAKLETEMLLAIANPAEECEDLLEGSLLVTLQRLKAEAQNNASELLAQAAVESEVQQAMSSYEPFAKFSVQIYVLLRRLTSLSPLYRFSAENFLQIFDNCLRNSCAVDLEEPSLRLRHVREAIFPTMLQAVAPSLFPEDRVPLAADLALIAHLQEGDNPTVQQAMEEIAASDSPPTASQVCGVEDGKRVQTMSPAEILKEVAETCQTSQSAVTAKAVDELASRVPGGGKSLVHGVKCTPEAALFDVLASFAGSVSDGGTRQVQPLLLCARGPGVDPSSLVSRMCREARLTCESIAVGDSESLPVARSALEYASDRWTSKPGRKSGVMMFKNMHLAQGDCVELVRRELLRHRGNLPYLLILACEVSRSQVSAGIASLANECRVLAFEAPVDFRSTLTRCTSIAVVRETKSAPAPAAHAGLSSAVSKLLVAISWLHAGVVEQCRYAPDGVSKAYDFSETDLHAAQDLVNTMFAEGNPSTAYDSLGRILRESVYGGRIECEQDDRVLGGFIEDIVSRCGLRADEPSVRVVERGDTVIDLPSDRRAVFEAIKELPLGAPGEWFGLRADAEEKKRMRDAWFSLKRLAQLRTG